MLLNKFFIISATSEIAKQTIKKLAKDNTQFYLTGRNEEELNAVIEDTKARGAEVVGSSILDVSNLDDCLAVVEKAFSTLVDVDCVLMAQGILPEQNEMEDDIQKAINVWNVNSTSMIAISLAVADKFRKQKKGSLAVITSVAADRGRKVNYLYGGSKAGVSTFLEGLRMRMQPLDIQILDIKPGPVKTPMTTHLGKMPLMAKPEKVAEDIVNALIKNKKVVYTPAYWRPIMGTLKLIPETIFQKLPF